jgi:hypothetical protein
LVCPAQGRRGAPPAPAAPLEAGASQADVDKALLALPEGLRNQTTVIKWKADFTYDTLRKGTNGLVLLRPFRHAAAAAVRGAVHQRRQPSTGSAEPEGRRRATARNPRRCWKMEQNGSRAKPEFGSVWYHLSGADRDHVSAHEVTIAVPGATQASLGLPEQRRDSGAWIMNAGTSTAHIMIPGR